jgi:hypothetical protein
VVLALLAGLALLVAACGSGKPSGTAVASLPSTSASAGPSGTAKGDPVKYSQCMRAHGITKFPDPNPNGGLAVDAGKLGVNPNSAQFKAADAACKSLLPQGPPPDPQQAAKMQQVLLAYSKCMRTHGITNFPDPKFEGNGTNLSLPRSVNPNSARFKAADATCRKLFQGLPGGGPGGSGPNSTGPGAGSSTGGGGA